MHKYSVLLYTTCKYALYLCEYKSYKPSTHKHTYIILHTLPHFVLTSAQTFLWTVLWNTHFAWFHQAARCTVILSSSLWTPVFCHYFCIHFAWPKYNAVQLKCTLHINTQNLILLQSKLFEMVDVSFRIMHFEMGSDFDKNWTKASRNFQPLFWKFHFFSKYEFLKFTRWKFRK